MLRVNQLIGFGAGVDVIKDIEIMQTDTDTNASGSSSYNLTCDIGSAEQGRVVFALISCWDNNSSFTVDSVTINGVSATQLVAETAPGFGTGGSSSGRAEIWAAQVNNGTGNQTVAVTLSTSIKDIGVTTIATRNVVTATAAEDSLTDTGSDTTVLDGSTVSISAGGIVLAVSNNDNDGVFATWSALTEVNDTDYGDAQFSGAYVLSATADNIDVSASLSGSNDHVAVACSVR